MRTALLRAAAVITFAATPAAAQHTAHGHFPEQTRPTRTAPSYLSGSLLPSLATRTPITDGACVRVSPAVDPSRGTSFRLGPGDSVGYTYYDLQTNAAMPDRIINWPNDALPLNAVRSTMVWTASTDNPPKNGSYAATTRGTYGAIHDGTSWSPMRGNWSRLEEIRTGFVEIDNLSDGRIVLANHTADIVSVWIELDAGTNEFFRQDIPGSERGLWASLAVTENDDIHVIWTYTTDDVNEDEVYYSRSIDEGNTFSDAVPLSGTNSIIGANMRRGFGANSYALAARGNNVAVWYLTSSIELMQLRSSDRGETWPSETAVFLFDPTNVRRYHSTDDPAQRLWPDPTFGSDSAVGFRTDTVPGPGSSLDLMLDDDGYTHGVITTYPTYVTRYYPPGGDTSASTFLRGTIFQTAHAYPDAGMIYFRERDNQYISSPVPQPGGLDNTSNPATYPNFFTRRAYHGGYSLYPQLGMDAASNVYLAFTSGIAGDVQQERRRPDSALKSWLNHHVFVTWMRADDEERRWMDPRNLTPTGLDAKYGALADLVDDELHIAYQIDPVVGEMITDTLAPIARERNNIEVLMMSKSSLSNPASVEHAVVVSGDSVTISPNPSRDGATVELRLGSAGHVTANVVDAMGRVVATLADEVLTVGTYRRAIDSRALASGVYFVVVRSGGTVTTTAVEVVH